MKGLLFKSVKFIRDYRTFQKGEEIIFRPGVNLIVGDQGVGKSTLLSEIVDFKKDRKNNIEYTIAEGKIKFSYFDMEKDNPRVQHMFKNNVSMEAQLMPYFLSHGETVMEILTALEQKIDEDPSVWIIDECDSGLSIRSCFMVAKMFKRAAEAGHQLLIVVYSQTIMEEFDEVLSVEHKKWMSSGEYIASQKEES